MKTYRSPSKVLAEVKAVLGRKPALRPSPLADVVDLLCDGRHYSWVGIYLVIGKNTRQQLLEEGASPHPGRLAMPDTLTKMLVEIKLAGRRIGVLDVESDRENAFGAGDRLLLEDVANLLARFLTGRGKYLVRKAREAAAAPRPAPARGPQSAKIEPESRAAAGGEK